VPTGAVAQRFLAAETGRVIAEAALGGDRERLLSAPQALRAPYRPLPHTAR